MVICKHKQLGNCASETCFNAKLRMKLIYGREYCMAFTKSPNAHKLKEGTGKTLQSTQNIMLSKMTELEKAQFKMTCLVQAVSLKQNPNTMKEYSGKDVTIVAKELEAFVLSKE